MSGAEALVAAVVASVAMPVAADVPRLSLPVDCTLGTGCFIQNYVDRDPGPGATDHACGPLTYDGHQGTDFALPDLAAMRAGVAVLAAAPGVVRGVRDGMPDIAANAAGAPPLDGRDCGNGVAIRHADGWETQYCHLARGSVAVQPGDSVAAGDRLGRIGLSGRTEFPHLHLTLRRDGAVIDPFGPDAAGACGPAGDPLWADPLPYVPGGLIAAGFADAIPAFDAIKAGAAAAASLPSDAPALVLWGHVFGGRAGDEMTFRIDGPGDVVLHETVTLDRTRARLFRAVGRRMRDGLRPGDYTGTVTLMRGNDEIGRLVTSISVSR